jgi:hypothetical protein
VLSRYIKFYLGVWIPLATCWTLIVLFAAWYYRAGLGIGLAASIGGTMLTLAYAAFADLGDAKGSLRFVSTHQELTKKELLRLGFRKGIVLGIASLLGVAFLFCAPIVADRLLATIGK